MGRYDGLTALVTGGGSGIGAAVGRALAAAGATVHVADAHHEAAAAVAREIGGVAEPLDVRHAHEWDALAAARPYDIALLAAGIQGPTSVADAASADLDAVIAVNLMGVVHGTRALSGHMAARGGGRIVAVSSAAGLFALPLAPAYTASKWGVVGWVLAAAPALASEGVVLTGVCPAWADTPFLGEKERELLAAMGQAIMPVQDVVSAVLHAIDAAEPGAIWSVDAAHGLARATPTPRFARV